MFKKLRTVILHVNDIEKAKAWYTKVTGIKPYYDQPYYVGFDINGFELGLDPNMKGITPGNSTVSYWAVDDIAVKVKQLEGEGASIVSDPQDVGGGIQVAAIKDPFGNTIGLIEGA